MRFDQTRQGLVRLLALVVTTAGIACQRAPSQTTSPANTPAKPDVLRANLDVATSPAIDFFQYANGGWIASHPIPPSEAGWSIGSMVREELYTKLRAINEDAAKKPSAPVGSDDQKIGDFWTVAMDQARADSLGTTPLSSELAKIDAIQNAADALDVAFALHPIGVGAFFDFDVLQDEKQSDLMSIHLTQGGLGLPDRDFYLSRDAGVTRIRTEYLAHMTRMLTRLGSSDATAAARAGAVMAFETSLATASRALADLRDPVRNYNRLSPSDLTRRHTPLVAWTSRLRAWRLDPSFVIVGQPEFFTALNRVLASTDPAVLRDYLRLALIRTYAMSLSTAIDQENFHFYRTVLSGQQEQRPRWKRVLDAQDAAMGMIVGRRFVAEYFPEKAKRRYSDLVEAIRTAYRARITALTWMSDATKAKAFQKLDAMSKKVGYPDTWKDYSALTVTRNSYCENLMHAARWRFDDQVSKFGKPVDRTEWEMTPQTYNAYYNPSNNEIVLPAAIFSVPGYRDDELDDAVVYGNAGASTIGHEITHGFDDEGRQFDAAGNLADWWTPADARSFEQRAGLMVTQFNSYEPLTGLHINGRASLGENIADYGGVLLGLDAFKQTEQYRANQSIAGLTPTQRYFLGYALGWLSQQRDENLRRGLLSDVHAPAKWRVLGPVSNIPDFYAAFGVQPGQPMWRAEDQRVAIW